MSSHDVHASPSPGLKSAFLRLRQRVARFFCADHNAHGVTVPVWIVRDEDVINTARAVLDDPERDAEFGQVNLKSDGA